VFAFILGIVLVLAGVLSLIFYRPRPYLKVSRLVDAGLIVVGVLLIVASMVAIVGTNKIAIVTSFNKPVDTYAAGWHGKAPWESTTELDGTRQTLRFEGKDGNKEDDGSDKKVWPCFNIKIENNATACINGIVSWQMKVDSKDRAEQAKQKERARQLFLNYRSFPRIIRDYIRPSAQSALQAVYANVNPLIPEKNPSYKVASDDTQTEFRNILGSEVDVLFVQITNADWDEKTDNAIKLQQEQIALTAQAIEKEKTNEAEAKAAAALTTDNGKPVDPTFALRNKCMDIAKAQGTNPGPCLNPGYGGILGPPQPK